MHRLLLIILFVSTSLSLQGQALSSIANAKLTPFGTAVRVRGILTNGPEGGSTRYVMDNTGGIGVFAGGTGSASRITFDAMAIGDSVEVAGTMGHFRCLIQIGGTTTVTNLGTRATTIPVIEYSASNWADAFSPGNIGRVVRLNGVSQMTTIGATPSPVTTFTTAGSGSNFAVQGNQNLAFRVLTASTLANAAVPTSSFALQGVMGRFQNVTTADTTLCVDNVGYQLIARNTNDLIVAAIPAPSCLGTLPAIDTSVSTSSSVNVTVNASAASGQSLAGVDFVISNRSSVTVSTPPYSVVVNGVAGINETVVVNYTVRQSDGQTCTGSRTITFSTPTTERPVVTIAQAKALNVNDTVRIRGVLTNGAEGTTTRYIMDGTGGIGVFVGNSGAIRSQFDIYVPGDSVEIIGRRGFFRCLPQVTNLVSVTFLAAGRPITPLVYTGSNIAQAFTAGNIGRVVRLRGIGTLNQGTPTGAVATSWGSTSTDYFIAGNPRMAVRHLLGAALGNTAIPDSMEYTGVIGRFVSTATTNDTVNCLDNEGYRILARNIGDIVSIPTTPVLGNCTLVRPTQDTTVGLNATVSFLVTATPPTGRTIREVRFYMNGSLSAIDQGAPYVYDFNVGGTGGAAAIRYRVILDNGDSSCTDSRAVIYSSNLLQPSTIAVAKSRNTGDSIWVKGVLTNGTEGGGTRYILDRTGGMGLFVGNTGTPIRTIFNGANLGDSVSVKGVLGYFRCLPQVTGISQATVVSRSQPINSLVYSRSQMGAAYTAGNIGRQVELRGINSLWTTGASPTQLSVIPTGDINLAINGATGPVVRILNVLGLSGTLIADSLHLTGVITRFVSTSTTNDTNNCLDNQGYQLVLRQVADYQPQIRSCTVSTTRNQSICFGTTYRFGNRDLVLSGQYQETLRSIAGCDSIVTLNLTVRPLNETVITVSICRGDSYLFNGQPINRAGTFIDTRLAANGCDSVITLNLSLREPSASSINRSICEGAAFNFGGQLRTSSGIYRDTLRNQVGCDSVITLQLVVNAIPRSIVNAAICSGQVFQFVDRTLTTAGTYRDTLRSATGCDSIITLDLQVSTVLQTAISRSICPGQSFTFGGVGLTSAGIYRDTLTGRGGCDSIAVLTLSISVPTSATITRAICAGQSFAFGTQTLTAAGNYSRTIANAAGCDSTISLNLVVNQPTSLNISTTLCPGQSIAFGSQTLTTAGNYSRTIANAAGCDSVINLALSFRPVARGTINRNICQGQVYRFNNQNLSVSGSYADTLTSVAGCDSILTLNLNVLPLSGGTFSRTICFGERFVFNGQTLTLSGQYLDTLRNAAGCDSILTLNLTVRSQILRFSSLTLCEGRTILFNGQTLRNSGQYRDTLISASGCDSVLVLNLTITPAPQGQTQASICSGDSLRLGRRWIRTAGVYSDTLRNANGCDTITSVTLTVNQRPDRPQIVFNSDSFRLVSSVEAVGYIWRLVGVVINDSDTAQSIQPTGFGPYTLQITNLSGCISEESDPYIFGSAASSIADAVKLYPNPAQNQVIIKGIGLKTIHVLNALGQVVLNQEANVLEAETQVNTDFLPSGMYIVQIQTTKGLAIEKLIIRK